MKTNVSVACFKFRCSIVISGKIIKEMLGSVASGTTYMMVQIVSESAMCGNTCLQTDNNKPEAGCGNSNGIAQKKLHSLTSDCRYITN